MKIRRGHVLVSVLSLGALLAYGCGDDTTAEDDGTQGPNTTTTTTTTTTVGPGSGGGGNGGEGGGTVADGTCAAPFVINAGAMGMGDTTGAPDNHRAPSSFCQAGSAGEHIYALTPTESGAVTITMTGAADMGIYVRSDCTDVASAMACVDVEAGGTEEVLAPINVIAGHTYFIFVDGYDVGEEGTYTLNVSAIEPENMCMDTMDENMDLAFDCEDASCFSDAMCSADIAAACAGAVALTPGAPQSGNTATGGTTLFAGGCTGNELAPESLYDYTAAQASVLSLTLASGTDQGVYVRTDCDDPLTQLECRDIAFGGEDEFVHVLLAANQAVTLFVDGYDPGEEGPFTLSSQVTNITETEGNNTYQMANAFAPPFVGFISPAADEDFVSIVVTANSDLTVSTTDVLSGDCAGSRIDTEVQILDTDGTTELAFNDDVDEPNANYCSSATATNLAAGTYFVRISASKMYCASCKMPYTLTVSN